MTAILTQHIDAASLLQESIPGIQTYYLNREQDSGGFSAGRYIPATVEDTYHAIKCLHCLNRFIEQATDTDLQWDFPNFISMERHMDFLKLRLDQKWSNARRLYHLLFCVDILDSRHTSGICPDEGKIREFILLRVKEMPALDECFYTLRIASLFEHGLSIPLDIFPHLSDYSVKSVSELRMLLSLLERMCSSAERRILWQHWRPWLQMCRNGDGGYGFFPGTTSYIENVFYTVMAYRLMQARPEKPYETTGFIRACRSAKGGFGRRCQGVPFPDSTWYGTGTLIQLSSI